MPLDEYRRKRKFALTPEPAGDGPVRRDSLFVVQKHDASRLHYDFRLEVDGVLTSWAVPRGPSMNPADKRLAIRTEDHPLEYADFEGVIPEGQYGAGPVIVWDRGTYDLPPAAPPLAQQLATGKVEVLLAGKKLRGGFALIRMKRSVGRSRAENWLLIKGRDEYADPAWNIERPGLSRSVLSGRTLRRSRPQSGGSRWKAVSAIGVKRGAGSPPISPSTHIAPTLSS